jgi:hypothetical protein
MEADQPAHMWRYWRDKKGAAAALRDYYPNVAAAQNPASDGLFRMECAERQIDGFFASLAQQEPDVDE